MNNPGLRARHHQNRVLLLLSNANSIEFGRTICNRGWYELRADDQGSLWEHFVLNEIHGQIQTRRVGYWRDKRGHEVDFIFSRRKNKPTAVECKWSASGFDPSKLRAFRYRYSEGDNFVVSHDVKRSYRQKYGAIEVKFVGLEALIQALDEG